MTHAPFIFSAIDRLHILLEASCAGPSSTPWVPSRPGGGAELEIHLLRCNHLPAPGSTLERYGELTGFFHHNILKTKGDEIDLWPIHRRGDPDGSR